MRNKVALLYQEMASAMLLLSREYLLAGVWCFWRTRSLKMQIQYNFKVKSLLSPRSFNHKFNIFSDLRKTLACSLSVDIRVIK